MKIFSIWANVSIPDEGRERVRREGVEFYIYIPSSWHRDPEILAIS